MKSLLRPILDFAVYFVARSAICVIQAVSMETCVACSRVLAYTLNDVLGVRRRVVDENLRHTFPHLSESERRLISRRMWSHLLLLICEVAQVPRKIHRTNWRQYVRIDQKRELTRYLLEPRPTIVVSGHFGNFEVAGYVCGLLGFPSYTIARTLDNPHLNNFINRFRGANGQYILPKNGSGKVVEAVLADGGIISLLGDQHAGKRGCWVEFLGRPASCHKALALFTLTSKAPMVVSYARRLDRPMHFQLGLVGAADPARPDEHQESVTTLTQWYNHQLEKLILETPDQYWWLHRRWKDRPERGKRASKATASRAA
ncbi:MAG: lysophospholipid acyltransferase family protein [Planctomycetales bacterium]|nr:lysophospholipid acyltransferase family protein [Planctomycetales bacterium]